MSQPWVELDLAALRGNLRVIRDAVGPITEVIAVVKANAYGHGLEPVVTTARDAGIRGFAVAAVAEGEAVRRLAPEARILVVGAIGPDEVEAAIRARLTPVLVDADQANRLARAAVRVGGTLECHAKIDTGMGRLGFAWEDAATVLPPLARLPGLAMTGACTHLAASEADDRTSADRQVERFQDVLRRCEAAGLRLPFRHVANSGAVGRDAAWELNGVRVGILMYGYAQGRLAPVRTRPFLHWKARIVQVKDVPAGFPVSYNSTFVTARPSRLATVAVGYSDGYFRILGNRGFMLAGGRRCPVRGRVTMNLTVIELGADNPASVGDEAVLLGTQGDAAIWADELGRWADTISYEILTAIRTPDRRVQ